MPTAKKAAVAKTIPDEKSTELSEQWLELAKTSEQTVTATLREFVETVEKAGGSLAKQREIINSGVEMARAILHAQYNAVRGLMSSAVLVNVGVNTNIDSDVTVKVPTNVNVASRKSNGDGYRRDTGPAD